MFHKLSMQSGALLFNGPLGPGSGPPSFRAPEPLAYINETSCIFYYCVMIKTVQIPMVALNIESIVSFHTIPSKPEREPV